MAVRVPVAATFDSSGVKEAQQAFANFGQSISRTLQVAGREARKNLQGITEGLEDSGSAADRLVASITKTSQKLDTQLKASAKAADALGNALGPELADQLGRSGVERLVVDLRKAGLTLEEITADADKLAAAIKQVDAVNLSNVRGELSRLDDATKQVGDSADRTRGVVANFAGNAAQELPLVTGAFGPLNTAIGQFAEYASEGGINAKKLVGAIGPLVAISVAIGAITAALNAQKKAREDAQKNTEAFTKSLVEGKDALDDWGASVIAAQELEGFDPDKGWLGDIGDLEPRLAKAGVKFDEFKQLIRKGFSEGVDALKEWRSQLILVENRDPIAVQRVYDLAKRKVNELGNAYKEQAENVAVYGRSTAGTVNPVRELNAGIGLAVSTLVDYRLRAGESIQPTTDLAVAFGSAASAAGQATQATEAARAALLELRNTQLGNLNAQFRYEESTDSAREAVEAYSRSQSKVNYRRARQEINDAATAAYDYALATSRLTDPILKEAEAVQASIKEYERYSATLAPGSKLRTDVDSWAQYLRTSIPPEVVTELKVRISGIAAAAVQRFGGIVDSGLSVLFGSNVPQVNTNNTTASQINARQQQVNNYAITINGPIDTASTAAELKRILNDDAQRNGLAPAIP